MHRVAVMVLTLLMCGAWAYAERVIPERRAMRDTVRRTMPMEFHDLRSRMMSSPQPVEIRQQGRQLCVVSNHAQLLPIYTQNGVFYTAFRLSRGTNWLSGLPRGSYIINNQHFAIK